ncbi:MAG TPA: hotdog domain-containing protein [Nocardioidaceae bacterium]|nr:hotdog domain-containing protein [Nocardioidaceae bacterium]
MGSARLDAGRSATLSPTITHADTASALGSGDLPVLATPRLLAWCEAATCEAVDDALDASRTTVGSRVSFTHERPSPVGAQLVVRATLMHVDGRLLRFEVVAEHADGTVVGHGEVTRVVVDRERFLARLVRG